MHLSINPILLHPSIGESDRHDGRPHYEALLRTARTAGLVGATVLRSPMGLGAACRMHPTKIIRHAHDLPIIIEIVDDVSKINAILPTSEVMLGGGLGTKEKVHVLHYRHGEEKEVSS